MKMNFPSMMGSLRRPQSRARHAGHDRVDWPWRRRTKSDAAYHVPTFKVPIRDAKGTEKTVRKPGRGQAGFTMVEIALSLAVIGFALVAIIGVLPLGLDVQKENREETIINHEASYFMDAIRNGERGLDDLTNYVTGITNYWTDFDANTNSVGSGRFGYSYFGSTVTPSFPLTNGYRIIGLLSTPKYLPSPIPPFRSNHVVAYVRALSGSAAEKAPQNDTAVQDLDFSYQLVSEVVPIPTYDGASPYGRNLRANLSEVRMLFRWPILPKDRVGNGREIYRSQVAGLLLRTNDVGHPLYFFEPTTFVNAP